MKYDLSDVQRELQKKITNGLPCLWEGGQYALYLRLKKTCADLQILVEKPYLIRACDLKAQWYL